MIDDVVLTPIALVFTLLMGVSMLLLPRRYAVLPLIVTTCYMTLGQRIVFLSLNFTIFRIMILIGWLRVIIRRDNTPIRLNIIDKAILWWVVASIITGILLDPTLDALINRSGLAYNAVGTYFLFRFYLQDFDDILSMLKVIAVLIVPLAISMLIEKSTGRNIFSFFGGVPEITVMRGGQLRCQGAFRHPILAGTFGATLMPLMVGFFFKGKNVRLVAIMGFISATSITIASSSGGPALSYVAGIVGMLMWYFRKYMRPIRWGILLVLIGLHMVMNAPVWFLIGRQSSIFGGGGWHRSEIIDQAIRHLNEWWLVGTKYTAHWMPYVLSSNPDMADITNQYIREGVDGGLIKMVLFIIIISLSFRAVGLYLRTTKDIPFTTEIMVWSIGVSLLVHCISFISVTYFDQMVIFWYLLLSMISVLSKGSEGLAVEVD